MITTILQGGMGNQMFQYVMGLSAARKLGVGLQVDATRLGGKREYGLNQWNIPTPEMTMVRMKPTVIECGMPYNQALLDSIKDGDVIQGYWQSEKYFQGIDADELLSLFRVQSVFRLELANQISEPNTAFIHVRRGDYLIEPHKSFQGNLTMDYYREAIRILKEQGAEKFFVFSDDIGWCAENFHGPEQYTFVSPGAESQDIYLMSFCQHAIIANSSFSWWGALLGDIGSWGRDRTVIAPERWFAAPEDYRDIVPSRWIKI